MELFFSVFGAAIVVLISLGGVIDFLTSLRRGDIDGKGGGDLADWRD